MSGRLALWRWRLRHPVEAVRAVAPRILSVDTRARILRLIAPLRRRHSLAGREAIIATFENELRHLPPQPRHAVTDEPPLASVIVVTFNNLRLTQLCIESVIRLTEGVAYELIVVDNASSDGTLEWLRGRDDLRLIENDANRGYPAAANQGAAEARGSLLCFLNNDTVVSPRWLSTLAAHLADSAVGAVGASTNAIGNEARVAVEYASLREMIAVAERMRERHRGVLLPLPYLAFFCIMLRRELWSEIGQLDERFGLGMFEDEDYCRRVHAAGYTTVCARDVFVHHWQLASFELLEHEQYLSLYRENEQRLKEKWRS